MNREQKLLDTWSFSSNSGTNLQVLKKEIKEKITSKLKNT